jgi:SAM-dependent methyltransferase
MRAQRFTSTQREYCLRANPAHYAWKTAAPYFAATEARLLAGVRVGAGERLLEIGCGEGGNLHHLRATTSPAGQRFGVDFSPEKVAFARRATGARAAVADAGRLPFADGAFDAVLIRDLLHHLSDRARALAEAHRVLRPGGRLTLIEPNARSPLVLLQAALIRAERGLLRSTDARLRRELAAAGFVVGDGGKRQPLPLARVVLHPRIGAESLGGVGPVARLLDGVDRMARRFLPRAAWMYLRYEAVRA